MYNIECRYEYLKLNSKEFTNWFIIFSEYDDENEAKSKMKELKSQYKYIEQKTKLKREYRVTQIEEIG